MQEERAAQSEEAPDSTTAEGAAAAGSADVQGDSLLARALLCRCPDTVLQLLLDAGTEPCGLFPLTFGGGDVELGRVSTLQAAIMVGSERGEAEPAVRLLLDAAGRWFVENDGE